MIRKFIQYFLCLILANTILFLKENSNNLSELEKFSNYIKQEGYKVENHREIIVVFDYVKIENYLENNLCEAEINKVSEMGFTLVLKTKKGIFLKEIKRGFYIRKGDLYVDGN